MKEFNPRALLKHLVVGEKNGLLLWAVCPALQEKFQCLNSVKVWVERIYRRVAASLDNGMGEGVFELPLYCFPSLKKKRKP